MPPAFSCPVAKGGAGSPMITWGFSPKTNTLGPAPGAVLLRWSDRGEGWGFLSFLPSSLATPKTEIFEVTPKLSVRKFCVECVGSPYQTEDCGGNRMIGQGDSKGRCYFFQFRNGKGRPSVKTIRRFCLECMQGSFQLVRDCQSTHCAVYKFRFGTNPNRAGIGFKSGPGTGVECGVFDQFSAAVNG